MYGLRTVMVRGRVLHRVSQDIVSNSSLEGDLAKQHVEGCCLRSDTYYMLLQTDRKFEVKPSRDYYAGISEISGEIRGGGRGAGQTKGYMYPSKTVWACQPKSSKYLTRMPSGSFKKDLFNSF